MQNPRIRRVRRVLEVWAILLSAICWIAACHQDGLTGGTSPPAIPSLDGPTKTMNEAAVTAGEVAGKISTSADTIDKNVTGIETKTAPEVRPLIQPEITGIRTETAGLRQDQAELLAVQQKLTAAEADLKKQQETVTQWVEYGKKADAANATLKDENTKLKDESAQELKKKMAYLAVICAAGIGISVLIAYFGKSKTAIAVAASFAVTLGICIAVSVYLKAIAIVTISIIGVAFLGAIGYLGWQFIKGHRAEAELVHTAEITKQYLPTEAREHLFGYGAEPGKIDQIQSKTTQNRVKSIRQYNDKHSVKLAPSMPEYWRPQSVIVRPTADPYVASGVGQRDTII